MIVIFVFIILYTLYYNFKSYSNNDLKLFDYVLFWFAFIYAFIPLFYYYDWQAYINPTYWKLIPDKGFLLESLIVLVSFIALLFGYKTYHPKGYTFKPKVTTNFKVYKISILLYIVGCLSFIYYINAYGGLTYILNNVSQIRSGTDDNKNYLGAIVKMFSSFITYGFILQLYLYHKGFYKKNKLRFVVFIVITVTMVATSLIDGGRAGMISKFIYIVLAIYFLKGKLKKSYIVSFVAIGLFVVFFGKTFVFAVFADDNEIAFSEVKNRQSQKGYSNLFVYEFNHQFLSLANFIQNSNESRYMKDYFVWFLKPMKLINGDPVYDSISYYNTFLIHGYWESDVPPGFVALGYMNGGVLVVLLQSIILGRFLKLIEVSMRKSKFRENGILFLVYIYLFNYSWFAIQNGDIALIIQSGLVFFIFIFLMIFFKGVKIVKNV